MRHQTTTFIRRILTKTSPIKRYSQNGPKVAVLNLCHNQGVRRAPPCIFRMASPYSIMGRRGEWQKPLLKKIRRKYPPLYSSRKEVFNPICLGRWVNIRGDEYAPSNSELQPRVMQPQATSRNNPRPSSRTIPDSNVTFVTSYPRGVAKRAPKLHFDQQLSWTRT